MISLKGMWKFELYHLNRVTLRVNQIDSRGFFLVGDMMLTDPDLIKIVMLFDEI